MLAEEYNARHHPARRTVMTDKFSMKAALFAVGCMPLLGGGFTSRIGHLCNRRGGK